MSVMEYANKFRELSRFAPVYIATDEVAKIQRRISSLY